MPTDTDTFTFSRSFSLSPEKMWHLMTDAKMREVWGAPGEGNRLDVLSSDLSVGGVDHHRCGPANNPEFEVETRWYRLDAPEAAVFTETIIAGGMRLGASLCTYAITPSTSGSDVIVTVAVSSFVGPEMIAEFKDGWSGGFEKLCLLAEAQMAS